MWKDSDVLLRDPAAFQTRNGDTAIYNGVNMWNEFSFVNTLTQSAQNRTLPLAIWEFQGQYSMNTPMIMAVLTLTLLPMVIMFIIFQDKLVKGMTAGAVKG